MSLRFDPRTGGMIRTKPSPMPAALARAMVEGAIRSGLAGKDHRHFDRLTATEQRQWIEAARFAIHRLGL